MILFNHALESLRANWPAVFHQGLWLLEFAILAAGLFWTLRAVRGRAVALLNRLSPGRQSVPAHAAILVGRSLNPVLLAAALMASAALLGFRPRWLQAVFVTLLIFQAGIWGAELLDSVLTLYAARRNDKSFVSAFSLLRALGKVALWSVILMLVLSNLGINITAMIAGLGIGGIAIGLAAQGIFADLFGSFAIVFDRPFVQGDFITFGDNAGTIEHVGVKSTRIRALSGEQIVLSNASLLQATIRNFQRLHERRIVLELGVTYQTPYAIVRRIPQIIRDVIGSTKQVRFDRSHFKSLGNSALGFEAVYYVLSPDYNIYMDAQQQINLEIMRRFEEEGIEFAYPTQTIFVAGNTPNRQSETAEPKAAYPN